MSKQSGDISRRKCVPNVKNNKMNILEQFNVSLDEYIKFCKCGNRPVVRRGFYDKLRAVIKIFPKECVHEASDEVRIYTALQKLKDGRIPRMIFSTIEPKGAYIVMEVCTYHELLYVTNSRLSYQPGGARRCPPMDTP
jgi:hypothetical protein